MSHCYTLSLAVAALLSLCACGSYDVTVNERMVYTARPLFADYVIPDAALRSCVERAVASGKVSAASELRSLDCSDAGIEELAGLASFTGIGRLRLSGNRIREVDEVAALTALETLYLDDNLVVDPVPLYQLPALRELDLSGNATLQCPPAGALLRVEALRLPRHCR
jgi:Leucine-rich repeat (LRR) protein